MNEIITSPQNKLIKQAAALKQKKYRDEFGLFVVEGVRLCEDFAASAWQGEMYIFTQEAAAEERVGRLLENLAAAGCRMVCVSADLFSKVSDTEQPQGIMVIAAKRRFTFADLLATASPAFIAVLDGIQDPGNVGAVIRIADAAGCSGVILTQGCADLFAGKTVRATMGSLFRPAVLEGMSRTAVLAGLEAARVPLVGTALEASVVYHTADLRGSLGHRFWQ